MQPTQQQHTCKNCGNIFIGKFCNVCGEKVYTNHDKSILHFFEEVFHFITHFEGTFFTTIKTIFTKPGQLSLDYCNGIRKKYFKPLPLFLLLIVLYLLFPVFEGLNMELKFYPNQYLYGAFAEKKITETLNTTGFTPAHLAEVFHNKAEKTSKFLMLVFIPFTALFFYSFTFLKRKYFFDSFVFAAEINSFYLLWGFLILPLLTTILLSILSFFKILADLLDTAISLLIYVPTCFYVGSAVKRFYYPTLKMWQSFIISLVFAAVHSFIVYTLYKFLLFVITINQIH